MSDYEDDLYDDAKSLFPKIEDLDGRLIAVWAQEQGARMGKSGEYTYVRTITLVLDDGEDGTKSTEAVPATDGKPIRLDKFEHSTEGIRSRLLPRLTGKNRKTDKPLRWRPMVGRVNSRPSQHNKHVPAYSIAEPTDADREILKRHEAAIREINTEVEDADAAF